jgi:geranylgeranyl pyrophosphate synthase
LELDRIYQLIEADLARVNEEIRSVSRVEYPWLVRMLEHSVQGGGKRIRPALTLLAGKFYDYDLKYLLPMATAVELMHTATLVHDDAIDKSATRRGRPTIYAVWGVEKSVLLGDYLFAKAGEYNASTQSIRTVMLFTQTLMTISKGELHQSVNAFNPEQTREQYIQRITGKTASLFALATESGAILSRAPEWAVSDLKAYGHNLGIAFQIVDDILDFIGTEEELGKPVGSDLAQGTLTLPAMILMERYPGDNPVRRIFERGAGKYNQEDIRQAIELAGNARVVQECYDLASGYSAAACRHLEHLPPCDSQQALADLATFVVRRKK